MDSIGDGIKRNADITPLEIENFRKSVGFVPNFGRYKKALKRTYAHFSIRKNGELIAFARVVSDGIVYAFIVDVIIHKDFQRQGIGAKLVKHIVAELKKDGIWRTQLIFVRKELEAFYKKCGFNILLAGDLINEVS